MSPGFTLLLVAFAWGPVLPCGDGAKLHAAESVSPIEKVVELLLKLKGKVQAEGAEEARLYEEFVAWCNSEATESKVTIANCEGKLEELHAQVETELSVQERLRVETESLIAEIASKEAELAEATNVRKAENADFVKANAGFMESIQAFDKAIGVLQGGGLLQEGALRQLQGELSEELQRAAAVASLPKERLDSFFERMQTGGKSETGIMTAAATSAAQAGQETTGAQIALAQQSPMVAELIQMLQQMRGDVVANRKAIQEEEKAKAHTFDLLKQSMELEIKNLTQNADDKKKQAARSKELQMAAMQQIDTNYALKTDTENYLAETETACQEQAAENQARQKSREEELAAIDEATDVLSSDRAKEVDQRRSGGAAAGSSLVQQQQALQQQPQLQLQQAPSFRPYVQEVWGSPPVGLSFLQQKATAKTRADPFGKVKDMISGMIVKLMDEAAEAAGKKAWCDEEETKTTAQLKKHQRTAAKLESRIGEMESEIVTHQEEVARLAASVKEMDAGAGEATKIRQGEAKAAQAALADFSEGQLMLQKALQVLSDFYEKKRAAAAAVLLQRDSQDGTSSASPAPPSNVGDAGAAERHGAVTGILGILEVAISDFAEMASHTQTAEATAQREYEAYMQTYTLQKAVSLTEAKNHEEAKTKTEGNKLQAEGDLKATQGELKAVLQYQEDLKKECNFGGPSHEERQARRQQQIGGLQNALAIISGDAVS